MKRVMIVVSVLMTSIVLSLNIYASQNSRDKEYEESMKSVLVQIDRAATVEMLQSCKDQLMKIADKYKDEWIPVYYIAYTDIQMAFFNLRANTNNDSLNEANEYLKKLKGYENADVSEIYNLWGYYYMALVAINPGVNGPEYYLDAMESFESAKVNNPDNPRPIVLQIMFERNMPEEFRPVRDETKEIARAKELFEKQTKSIDMPYWGEYFVK